MNLVRATSSSLRRYYEVQKSLFYVCIGSYFGWSACAVAARAQHDVARAELLNAGLLPDPVISGGLAALISGPGDAPAISGSLMQDVSALVTCSVNIEGAKTGLAQGDAGILWQEWQVASRAGRLCIAVAGGAEFPRTLSDDRAALSVLNGNTNDEVFAGSLTTGFSSASLTALAATDTALDNAQQALAQDKAQLNALLGLQRGVDIAVTPPDVPSMTAVNLEAAVADRQHEAISLRTQLLTARLSLATLLGIGLPPLVVPDLVASR